MKKRNHDCEIHCSKHFNGFRYMVAIRWQDNKGHQTRKEARRILSAHMQKRYLLCGRCRLWIWN